VTQDLMNEPATQARPDQSMGSMGNAEANGNSVDLSTIKDSAIERLVAERQTLTESLRAFTGDLRNMQESSPQSGLAASLVQQAADRAEQLAEYVEQREPQQLLGEARSYAQSHPGMFLVGAAVAGGILGRVTRSATEAATSNTATTPVGGSAASSQSTQEPHAFAPTPTSVDVR
jgi:hypothetical protein